MAVWFVTGASKGLGKAIVEIALRKGHSVATLSSRAGAQALSAAHLPLQADLADPDQVLAAVTSTLERFGRIDIVINAAGRGLFGPIEEASDGEIRAVFDVTFFGTMNVIRATLPCLRAAGSGRIFNITSVAGFAATPGEGVHSAANFAIEGLSEALASELSDTGVTVHLIEPGKFRTHRPADMRARHTKSSPIPEYEWTVEAALREQHAHLEFQPGDPAKAAAVLEQIGTMSDPPFRIQLGSDAVVRVHQKLASVETELKRWSPVAISTDY